MAYVDIVTALALIQYMFFGSRVAVARQKYGVTAPAVMGNAIFERHFRVQQNTLESLLLLLPGLYIFCRYFNPLWAAGLGAVYLIGRLVYASAYVRDPEKRGPGFGLTLLPIVILIAGSGIGAVLTLLHG